MGPEKAGRALRCGLLLLVVAGISALLLAGPAAQAAPSDPVGPLPTAGPSPTPGGDGAQAGHGGDGGSQVNKPKSEKEKERLRKKFHKQVEAYLASRGGKSGVLSAFEVTDQYGIPAGAYQVSVDSGGVTDFDQRIQAFLIEGMFSVTKWMIAFACWLISWALSWSLAAILLKPAMAVSDALYNQAIVQLGLPSLLLTFSGVVAIWHLFFGRRSRGWGEVAASTLISALAVTTFAAPPQMLLSTDHGAVGQVRELGLAVAVIVLDQGSSLPDGHDPQTKDLTRPVTDKLVEAFVVQPSMLLSYNQTFTGKCAELYSTSRVEQAVFNQAIDRAKKKAAKLWHAGRLVGVPSLGESIDDFLLGKAMDLVKDQVIDKDPGEKFEEECVKGDADEAQKASWDKTGGALFVLLATALVFVLMLVLGCSYLITQALLAFEAMFARVALTVGILPGPGRAWLWERGASVLRLLGLLLAIVIGLATFILIITTVLGANSDAIPGGLTIRFVVVDLLCVAAFRYRKKLTAKSKALASELRGRMGSTRFGGSSPAQLENSGGQRRRSAMGSLLRTGLLLGTMAATGGTSAAGIGLSRGGSSALGTRLAAHTARRGAAAAGRSAAGTAKAAAKVGTFGLKYSVGAPVYGPRAARAAGAAVRGMPQQARESEQSLRDRLDESYRVPAQSFAAEYWHNIGGRWAHNQVRARRGLPPIPAPARTRPPRPAPPRMAAPRGWNGATATPTPPGAAEGPAPAAPTRTAPPHPAAPAATARHAALQRRLQRARLSNARPPQPPAPPRRPGPGRRRP